VVDSFSELRKNVSEFTKQTLIVYLYSGLGLLLGMKIESYFLQVGARSINHRNKLLIALGEVH
jgi:hypothetical protein